MTAIQIRVNGKLVATCGPGVLRQLVEMVAAQRPIPWTDPDTPGVAERRGVYSPDPVTDEVLKWVAHGDAVSLKFVDGAQPVAQPGDQQGVQPGLRADG